MRCTIIQTLCFLLLFVHQDHYLTQASIVQKMIQVNEPMPPKFSPTESGPSPPGEGHHSLPTQSGPNGHSPGVGHEGFHSWKQSNRHSPGVEYEGPSPRGQGHDGDSMPTSRFQKMNQLNEPMPPKFSPTESGPSPPGEGHHSLPTQSGPNGHSPGVGHKGFPSWKQSNRHSPGVEYEGPSLRGQGHDGDSMPTSRFQKMNQVNEPMPPKFSPTESGPSPPGEGHHSLPTRSGPNGHSPGVGHEGFPSWKQSNRHSPLQVWNTKDHLHVVKDTMVIVCQQRFQKMNQVNEPMPPKFSPTESGPSPPGEGHHSLPTRSGPNGHSPGVGHEALLSWKQPDRHSPGVGHEGLLFWKQPNGHSPGAGHEGLLFWKQPNGPSRCRTLQRTRFFAGRRWTITWCGTPYMNRIPWARSM